MRSTVNMLFFLALLLFVSATYPQSSATKPEGKDPKASQKDAPVPKEESVVTQHSVTINGQVIKYTATVGTLLLKEEQGKAKASVFFIAYTKNDGKRKGARPITFSFNGGPGSSSVWLHLGVLGPKRVYMNDQGFAPSPPYHLVDNDHSLLDETDLVFIDPVSTGYSRAVPGEDPKQFHGVKQDIESVGDFIRLYTTRFERWDSPKFLIGESYGTTRAAGLSGYLQNRHGMYLNGIMLISSILDFQTARFDPGNDLPYILFLPTYTATAWYHHRLSDTLQQDFRKTLTEAQEFAQNEYALALMKGAELGDDEKKQIVTKLAKYTGLSPQFIEDSNLRVPIFRFVKELLRADRLTVGRLDSRFTGIDRDAAGENFEYDPSYAAIQGSFTGTLNAYVRHDLGFKSDLPYEILTGRVRPWNFKNYENRYVNVAETLREAMTKNRNLKLFVANGYYDLATPFFATLYTINHLGLEPELQGNVTMGYYEAGHMMYIHRPSLVQLKHDLANFIQSSTPQ